MFDYYKINTLGKRKCTKTTHNETCGRNFFVKLLKNNLTSETQISYLSNCSIQNLNETRLTNNDLRNKNEERCSSSYNGNKIKFVRSVNNEI